MRESNIEKSHDYSHMLINTLLISFRATLECIRVFPTQQLTSLRFSPHGATASSGPGFPPGQGFTITPRHTTFGRNPLDE